MANNVIDSEALALRVTYDLEGIKKGEKDIISSLKFVEKQANKSANEVTQTFAEASRRALRSSTHYQVNPNAYNANDYKSFVGTSKRIDEMRDKYDKMMTKAWVEAGLTSLPFASTNGQVFFKNFEKSIGIGSSTGLNASNSYWKNVSSPKLGIEQYTRHKKITPQYDEAPRAGNDENAKPTSVEINRKASAISRLAEEFRALKSSTDGSNSSSKKAGNLLNRIADAIKNIGKSSKKSDGALAKFITKLKNIVLYRTVRQLMSQMAQSFREGIQNITQYDVALNGLSASSANAVMSSFAESFLYIKNSIGAGGIAVLEELKDVFYRIADAVADAFNNLGAFFALMQGKSTYTKAIRSTVDYSESLNKASGSAKELKRQLMGFDEINKLTDTSSSGGGSAVADYATMFEEAEVATNKFLDIDFVKELKDAWSKGDWSGLGKIIGDKFNSILDNLRPDKLAQKIASTVNNAFAVAYSFLTTADFEKLGEKVGIFLSDLNIDFETIGRAWVRFNTNILDAIWGMFKATDWKKIGNDVGSLIKGLFDEFNNWCKDIDWKQIGKDLATFFLDMIEGINWTEVVSAIATAIDYFVKAGFNLFLGFGSTIGQKIADVLNPAKNATGFDLTGYKQEKIKTEIQTNNLKGTSSDDMINEKLKIKAITKANGGTVSTGQLFIANEAGAELVGQVGGRTTVTNQEQFTQSLQIANADVINAVLAIGNAITSAVEKKDTNVYLDSMQMARGLMNANKQLNTLSGRSLVL